jgi:thiamine-phosphate pyrophosphorylase
MEAKPCGLIAVIPPALEGEWAKRLAELIGRFKPAALVLQAPPTKAALDIIARAQAFELAVLFWNAVDVARKAGASGVYFSAGEPDVAGARKTLGADAILGAGCGLSRHAAMESSEAGADFVAFDASSPEKLDEAAELSLWWDEISGVPSALLCIGTRPEPSVIEKARPDFLILQEAETAGESLTFAIELGLQSQR